jgi:hypothetical protein
MADRSSGWGRELDAPIALPDSRNLVCLRDAASYITALERIRPSRMAACDRGVDAAADLGGPTMFTRIGVMRALNRHHVREFNPSRKEHHWGGESSRDQ